MTIRSAVSGFIILGSLAGFVLVSHGWGSPRLHLPLYALAAVAHLVAVVASRRARDSRRNLSFAIALALSLRLVVFLTPESREGDYYRYMWDGALTANGISPYRFSPAQVLNGEVQVPEILALSQEGQRVLTRINHPGLRTLYPPLAESLFALSYFLDPFNSTAWRVVLLVLDIAGGVLILFLLRRAQLPSAWSICYLWNPLVIVETYHYRHLDLALAPFLLVFLWGLWKRRPYLAAMGLAAAVAIKIWPVLLLPFLATRFWTRRSLLAKAVIAFVIISGLLFIPYWMALRDEASSGSIAYAKTWNANELAFRAVQAVGFQLSRVTGDLLDDRLVSRALLLLMVIGAAMLLGFRARTGEAQALALSLSTVVFLMILAGPTVYPWYFVPAVALSPFLRRPALLLWAPLLILTYLARSASYSAWLPAVVHLPAWLMLIVQVRDLYRRGADADA